jgi:type I restriction enzyme R subunit
MSETLDGIPDNIPYVQIPLPFAYETTGIETFFRDFDLDTRSRRLFAFHKPQTLYERLSQGPALRIFFDS